MPTLDFPPGASVGGTGGSEYGEDICRPVLEKGCYNGGNRMISATGCATLWRNIFRSAFATHASSVLDAGAGGVHQSAALHAGSVRTQDESQSLCHTKTERPRSAGQSNYALGSVA